MPYVRVQSKPLKCGNPLYSVKRTGFPVPTVPELYKIHLIVRTPVYRFHKIVRHLVDSKARHYNIIVTYRANLSQHRMPMERSENAALWCSPARAHITMPTGSMLEATEIQISPYYGHTVVVPTVSALEGFHCIYDEQSLDHISP